MKERIKDLRIALGMTQQEFSDRIGVSRSTVANYEIGRGEPLSPVVSLIVHQFNVNEHWLRTGEGDMFLDLDPDQEAAMVIGKVFAQDGDHFRKRLLHIVATLPEDQLHMVFDLAKRMVGEDDPADQ